MRLIQRYLPHPKLVEIHRCTVKAPPEVAWRVARHFDMGSIPWVRWLFGLRTLPSRLSGASVKPMDHLGVDAIAASDSGFMILGEEPGREVVVGAIGAFWRTKIPFVSVEPSDFAAYDEEGAAKVAWAIRVEPFGIGSVITIELRTTATDEASWNNLQRYFAVIGIASRRIRAAALRSIEAELGPHERPNDEERALPGDDLLGGAHHSLTHSIDIEASPALVWPWLMQLGCDRGGWYSIDALDHGGVPSVDQLRSEWQARAVGDRVSATPEQDDFYRVMAVTPQELLVLGGEAHRIGGHIATTWSFVLEPIGEDTTHLIARVRARGTPRWSEWLQGAVVYPPVHAIMQKAQLDNLKRLAEREAHARA